MKFSNFKDFMFFTLVLPSVIVVFSSIFIAEIERLQLLKVRLFFLLTLSRLAGL